MTVKLDDIMESESYIFDIPSYPSVTTCPPVYCPYAASGEQSLLASPLGQPQPSGTYKKKSGRVTLILTGQDECAHLPSYGRQGTVNGIIGIENRQEITEVHVKVCGMARASHLEICLTPFTLADRKDESSCCRSGCTNYTTFQKFPPPLETRPNTRGWPSVPEWNSFHIYLSSVIQRSRHEQLHSPAPFP